MNRATCAAALALVLSTPLWAQRVSVRDSLDRPVSLAAAARRVVSLSPSATETLFALGAGDAVVGVTDYCNWPAEAATRPRVGGYSAQSISLERVLALRPDLVVSDGSIHASVRKSLEGLGMTVYAFAPENVEGTLEGMADLGRLTGRNEDAIRLVRGIRAGLDEVAARFASVPESSRVRVFWEVNSVPIITCGSRSFLHDLIVRAGGVNVFGDIAASWPVVSSEEIVLRAPQVLLAADDLQSGLTTDELARRPGWSTVPAVRDGRVRFLPADPVSRTGPRLAQGVLLIARALYPELFP